MAVAGLLYPGPPKWKDALEACDGVLDRALKAGMDEVSYALAAFDLSGGSGCWGTGGASGELDFGVFGVV